MVMNKVSARFFGFFFILSFLSYGIGMGLMEIVQNTDVSPKDIVASRNQIVLGVILVSVFHTLFNIGLVVVMLNVIKPYNQVFSYLYFCFGLAGALLLAIGGISLISLIPVYDYLIGINGENDLQLLSLVAYASRLNFYTYQVGMFLWGCGGLFLCYLLYVFNLVPRMFPAWGLIGYLIFILGTCLELFGHPVGVLLSIPGGLFEISLSLWLIVKGFSPARIPTV
jgi:hypothetical protein